MDSNGHATTLPRKSNASLGFTWTTIHLKVQAGVLDGKVLLLVLVHNVVVVVLLRHVHLDISFHVIQRFCSVIPIFLWIPNFFDKILFSSVRLKKWLWGVGGNTFDLRST